MPRELTLVLDSTAVVLWGEKEAGAEVGYNPKTRAVPLTTRSSPSSQETGD